MQSSPTLRWSVAGAAAAVLLTGCTVVPPGATATPTESVSPSVSAGPDVTMTAPTVGASPDDSGSPSAPPSPPSPPSPSDGPSTSPDASASATPGPSQSPGLLTVAAGQRTQLGIANAFHADGWSEGSYQVPGTGAPVTALGAVVNCGQGPVELEYRFSTTRGTAQVTVAQDILSDSADNTLEFLLVADGKQSATKAVTFKQTAELTAPLAGVTVLKVVARSKGTCKNNTTALITQAHVQG